MLNVFDGNSVAMSDSSPILAEFCSHFNEAVHVIDAIEPM